MKIKLQSLVVASIVFASPVWATNGEDDDLGFLPPIETESEVSSNKAGGEEALKTIKKKPFKFTIDNTTQISHLKDTADRVFKLPETEHAGWSNLSRLGLQSDSALSQTISLKTDLLLNAYTRENESFHSSADLRLDIKETYLSWQKTPTIFFDMGRINIKNGVATGFNPTDYFKVGTVLDRNTEDVSQLRDARIGAALVQGQKLWEGGSATLIASPKISSKDNNWTTDKNIVGLNLHKSNDRSRALLKLTHELNDGFSPEFIYYNESGKHNLGLNISKVITKKLFAYAEWNIGQRRKLIDEAFLDARESKQLLPVIQQKFGSDKGERYLQQTAVGASYTSLFDVTTKLEYHYNEAGLSKSDFKAWFDLGVNTKDPARLGQLLSVRGLAQARGEALGKHRLFLHSTWNDAGFDDLDLTGLLIADLSDTSNLVQVKASYTHDKNTEISLQFAKFSGEADSVYGSLDQENTVSIGLKHDF